MLTDSLAAEPQVRPSPSRRGLLAAALVPAGLMAVVGSLGIGAVEPWRDELATWSAASRSVGDLFAMARNADAFYLPYYLFMHFWIAVFGDSTVSMRIPSLLAVIGATAAVSILVRRWFDVWSGFCAGILFALVPMVSRMGQEARPYAFLMLFVALSTLALTRAVEDPRWSRWVLYALSVIGVGVGQLTALALGGGHLLFVLVRNRRVFLPFAVSFVVGLLPLLPLAVLSLTQPQQWIHLMPAPDFPSLLGFSYPFPPGSAVWPQVFRSTSMAWIVLGLVVLAVVVNRRRRDVVLTLGVFVVPIIAVWVASHTGSSFYIPRYLVFLLPVMVIGAGVALTSVRWRAVSVAALLVVGVISVPDQLAARSPDSHDQAFYPYANLFSEHPGQYASYSQLAAAIQRDQRPGDAVVYASRPDIWFADTGIAYYLRDHQPRDVFAALSPVQADSLYAVETTDFTGHLAGVNRIWVVGVGERQNPFTGNPRIVAMPTPKPKLAAVQSAFTVSKVTTVPGFTLALMTRR